MLNERFVLKANTILLKIYILQPGMTNSNYIYSFIKINILKVGKGM